MSELDDIASRLNNEFVGRRIVVWHDQENEYGDQVQLLELDNVEIIRVDRNQFGTKARVLVDKPRTKFLLYRSGPIPADADNWLLDVELAYGVFRADRVSMVLELLSLSSEYRDVVATHPAFFRATKRSEALRKRLEPGETPTRVLAKMCAVLAGAKVGHRMSSLLRPLLTENAKGDATFFGQIVEYSLDDYFWGGMARIYNYRPDAPSIDDFVLWSFEHAVNGFAPDAEGEYRELQFDFLNMQVDRTFAETYRVLAERAGRALGIEKRLEAIPYVDLLDNTLFEEVDRRILRELIAGVEAQTISFRDVDAAVAARLAVIRGTKFENYYVAVRAASALLTAVDGFTGSLGGFEVGLNTYANEWFRIDQHYRHFVHAFKSVANPDLLEVLRDRVENVYVNDYLHSQGLEWQKQVDARAEWKADSTISASSFHSDKVKTVIMSGQRKVAVIISDALRYEVADELRTRLLMEDRYDAKIEAMLGALPSFTQLGMASLLPHKSLKLMGDGSLVSADGKPTAGIVNRQKILSQVGGTAIKAQELLSQSEAESRSLITGTQVLYVYHNRIDAMGDKAETESSVFEAAETTIAELIKLVKKLTAANVSNVLITADHGFQYQDKGLEESGYLSDTPKGDFLVKQRFVIGVDLPASPALRKFTSAQLGLEGELEVQIPKSTHRIRHGAGQRFVHGGASLQEIVIPLVAVNKARKSDTRRVEVQLMPGGDKITTGQLTVRLNQVDPVDEKVQPRALRVGVYGGETLVSNLVERAFDLTTDDALARIMNVTLLLSSDADSFEGKSVQVRLEEREGKTNYWKTITSAQYTLKRSFSADF